MYDIIIIGAGPAGLTAAIYARRQNLKTAVIEKLVSGGQMIQTSDISNFPGHNQIMGYDLSVKFEEHAKSLDAEFFSEQVTGVVPGNPFTVQCGVASYETKSVIYAAGANKRKLGVPGEEEFAGRGVSYCATCDGGFFKNKVAAVIGGGSTALEEAIYLSCLCQRVCLIHRRTEFRGERVLADKVMSLENVELLLEKTVTEITGNGKVEALTISDVKTGENSSLTVDGVFIAVGTEPNTDILPGEIRLDENGYIIAGEDCATSVGGLFAAGDSRTKPLRQIITAASDGAVAASQAGKYISQLD